jgi:hypothetical protein
MTNPFKCNDEETCGITVTIVILMVLLFFVASATICAILGGMPFVK